MDINKTREIQKEKEEFPEKFKHQIDLILQGFEQTLRLIEELPNKQLTPNTNEV